MVHEELQQIAVTDTFFSNIKSISTRSMALSHNRIKIESGGKLFHMEKFYKENMISSKYYISNCNCFWIFKIYFSVTETITIYICVCMYMPVYTHPYMHTQYFCAIKKIIFF